MLQEASNLKEEFGKRKEERGAFLQPVSRTKWLLAEGRSGGDRGFQTYILLANPAASAANVTVTYLRTNDTPVVRTYVVPAASRFNVNAGEVPELADQSFGALVEVTNGVGIVVERSMYWNAGGAVWAGGTNTAATRIP